MQIKDFMFDSGAVSTMPYMPLKYREDAGSQMISKMKELIIDSSDHKRTECLKFIVNGVMHQIIPYKQAKYARDLEAENEISKRIQVQETSAVLNWLYFVPKYFRKIWNDYKIKKLENLLLIAKEEQGEKFSQIITKWLDIDKTLDEYLKITQKNPGGVKYPIIAHLLKPECQTKDLSHDDIRKKWDNNDYVCELFKKLDNHQHSSDQEKINCADTILQDIKSWVDKYNNLNEHLNEHGVSMLSNELKINIVNYLLMPDTVKKPLKNIHTEILKELKQTKSTESIDPKVQTTLDYLEAVFTQFNQDTDIGGDRLKKHINQFIDSSEDIPHNNCINIKDYSNLNAGEVVLKDFQD